MPFSYANPTSGPSAGGIGWFNFENLSLNPGDTVTGLTGTLNDGTTVTFDITATNVSGSPRIFAASAVPTYVGAQFGITGYTGIAGNVAMQTEFSFSPGANRLTLSNIVVKDAMNNPVPNYTAVVADAESTGLAESWEWQTDGEAWKLLTKLGNQPSPVLSGLNTQTAMLTGIDSAIVEAAYLLSTQNPTQLVLTTATTSTAGGREAVSVGFATTRIKLQKNIGQRIDSLDQFALTIGGTPNAQATTSGAVNGIQPAMAEVYAIPGSSYSINEAMAAGSVSVLADYTKTFSAANATPAGSVPPTGSLPINFSPILGDNVTYTILNAAPEIFQKTVDKQYANIGEIVTYTITVDNPNNFAINNVLVTDVTPAGTIYLGNLIVSAPYTGTDLESGITITTIAADSAVTLTWQVQVNMTPPISNPVLNYANVVVPGGVSGMTNVVVTQINTAYITVHKIVDKSFVKPGDILTYTIMLNNAGNVSANNVVISDIIPLGTTFVAGSLIGATGTPPTFTLLNAIPAGGNALVSFQVKVGSNASNPIANTAIADFTYTVDPQYPNTVLGKTIGNTVETVFINANVTIKKAVNKPVSYLGEIITYQLFVENKGNVAANSVMINDILPNGTTYEAGTLLVSVPFTGIFPTIQLTNPLLPGQNISISFKAKIVTMPLPNPMINQATLEFKYTIDPLNPNGEIGTASSNKVSTLVLRNNYEQEINDLIESVALEQAALAAIANAEGAKIQKMVSMNEITTQELLCLNKSVSDMLDSIQLLETILRQKLKVVDCQINGNSCK